MCTPHLKGTVSTWACLGLECIGFRYDRSPVTRYHRGSVILRRINRPEKMSFCARYWESFGIIESFLPTFLSPGLRFWMDWISMKWNFRGSADDRHMCLARPVPCFILQIVALTYGNESDERIWQKLHVNVSGMGFYTMWFGHFGQSRHATLHKSSRSYVVHLHKPRALIVYSLAKSRARGWRCIWTEIRR